MNLNLMKMASSLYQNAFQMKTEQNSLNILRILIHLRTSLKRGNMNLPAGPDGIDYTIYKLILSAAAKMTAAILKICLNAGRVPANWKTSVTRLIYKKDD